jgi:GNAT superfamily N-acetyltransferase
MSLAPSTALPSSVRTLSEQALVFEQFDWQPLAELLPHIVIAPDGAAGMCVVPVFDDAGRAEVAWLRWAAQHDRVGSARALAGVVEAQTTRLRALGIDAIWAICRRGEWIGRALRDTALGFRKADEIITLDHRAPLVESVMLNPPPDDIVFKTAGDGALAAIAELDARAFASPWRYTRPVLARASAAGAHLRLATRGDALLAYCCATSDRGAAHVIRLAVEPDLARRGIGRALLADTITMLYRGGAQRVTINTPASFTAMRLYRQLGFRPMLDVADVLTRNI